MQQITLNIPDGKLDFFLEVFSRLGLDLAKKEEDLSPELIDAIGEARKSYKQNGGRTHNQVINEFKEKYPNAFRG
jgi:hypothetical protein